MPAYNTSPLAAPPVLLQEGLPTYLYGSLANNQAPTRLQITAVSATSTILTYYVTVLEGNIPAVGNLLTVSAVTTDAQFNITNGAITAVTITAATGIGTITYTSSGLNTYGKTTDSGYGLVPVPEVSETIANGKSIPCATQWAELGTLPHNRIAQVTFPTIPTTGTVYLQESINNIDAEYSDIATVATVAAGVVTGGFAEVQAVAGRFYRFRYASLAGSGKIIAKII